MGTNILDFVLNLMKDYNIPVQQLQSPFSNMDQYDFGLRSGILNQPNILHGIDTFFQNIDANTIYFLYDIFDCKYIIFYHPKNQFLYCIGPFLSEQMTISRLDTLIKKLDLPETFQLQLMDYYNQISVIPAPDFVENMFVHLGKSLYSNKFNTVHLDFNNAIEHYQNIDTLLLVSEKSFSKTDMVAKRAELESAFISAVSMGNESKAYKLAQTIMEIPYKDKPYKDKPPVGYELRYYKNYLISISAILRKIIEYTGIHPIHFHDLHQHLFIEIENCTRSNELDLLLKRIISDYCKVIKNNRHSHHSPVIQTILTHIDTDLSADLTLKSFAKYLNLTPSYLSDLFSKEMGISLTNYVTQKRMQLAQILLGMTTLSVKTVAENCGFSDIQYFNRTFRKYTGLTPKAYHNTYYVSKENIMNQFSLNTE